MMTLWERLQQLVGRQPDEQCERGHPDLDPAILRRMGAIPEKIDRLTEIERRNIIEEQLVGGRKYRPRRSTPKTPRRESHHG